jgi:hypothetical protein
VGGSKVNRDLLADAGVVYEVPEWTRLE